MSDLKKPAKMSQILNSMMSAGIAHWAAEQGARMGAAKMGSMVGSKTMPTSTPESREPTVRYKFWQVGWEDEVFEFDLPKSVITNERCPACHVTRLPDAPGLEGCVSFFAFHPVDAPEKVEARCMEVILNPLAFMWGARYGFMCATVSLEEARRRQPDENPRDNS